MPFENCEFLLYPETPHPVLPIIIHNPHTGKHIKTFGLIDTGADECAIPAWIALRLGHVLEDGVPNSAMTGGGEAISYKHSTSIEFFQKENDKDARHTLANIPVDYMTGLDVVLLGVKNFLDRFVLTVDYPHYRFSLRYPEVDPRDTI